jgi:hypothetical protein
MSAPRFYCPPPLPLSTNFELPPAAAAHHASRVLRLRVNDAVQIFDGIGNALDATINQISAANASYLATCKPAWLPVSSGLHIVLAQAMCSSDKMDWIVQKATELGVSRNFARSSLNAVLRNSQVRVLKSAPNIGAVSPSPPVNNAAATICQKFMPRLNWKHGYYLGTILPLAVNLSFCRAVPPNCMRNPNHKSAPHC